MSQKRGPQLNIRPDSMALEAFKSQAAARGLDIKEYFKEMVNDRSLAPLIDSLKKELDQQKFEVKERDRQIQQKDIEIDYLKSKLNINNNKTRKVYFNLEEHQIKYLTSQAHKYEVSRSNVLSVIMKQNRDPEKPNLPMLEVSEPKISLKTNN